jgi:hypothetical protein
MCQYTYVYYFSIYVNILMFIIFSMAIETILCCYIADEEMFPPEQRFADGNIDVYKFLYMHIYIYVCSYLYEIVYIQVYICCILCCYIAHEEMFRFC